MKAVLLAVVALLGAGFAFSAEWRVVVNGAEVPLRRSRAEYYAPYAYGSFEVKGGEKVSVTAPDGTVETFVAEPRVCRCFRIGTGADPYKGKVEFEDYTTGGSIENVVFRNVSVTGEKGAFCGEIWVKGRNADEAVRNVVFENVTRFGETVLADSPAVTVGPFAEARFVAASGRAKEKEGKTEK